MVIENDTKGSLYSLYVKGDYMYVIEDSRVRYLRDKMFLTQMPLEVECLGNTLSKCCRPSGNMARYVDPLNQRKAFFYLFGKGERKREEVK